MEVPKIIPLPREWNLLPGTYDLPQNVSIGFQGVGSEDIAHYLSEYMDAIVSSVDLKQVDNPDSSLPDLPILLSVESEGVPSIEGLPHVDEAYDLRITDMGIAIRANAAHGLFNGVISLLQLLPPCAPMNDDIKLECMEVVDAPRFDWRGVLLDVGRHFFPVPFILKILDICALYKMNRFHWHLTEDQGWRLEIKAYPKLTEFGAWRGKDEANMYGGFYTQEDVREVVAYAARRFIIVVPEIELPGHCGAALACYPYLSCTGDIPHVPRQWGVHEDVYCAGKEDTFTFLQNVLREVLELFPSQYIHIGGDECPKTRWRACEACQRQLREANLEDEYALQSWFVGRINKFLRAQGRQLIGWDEILEGGLSPGAVVMSWRGVSGGVKAAKAGHEVIMSPTSHCYFDYRQSLKYDEPGAWYAMLPLEMVYAFDPVPPPPAEQEIEEEPTPDQETSEILHESPLHSNGVEERAANGPGGQEEELVGPLPPAPATPPQDCDSVDIDVGLDSASTGIQPMSVSGPGSPIRAREDDGDADIEEDEPEEGSITLATSRRGATVAECPEEYLAAMDENGGIEDASQQGSVPVLVGLPVRPQCPWTLEPEHAVNIKGGQANVWTEYISDEATVEYMLMPRLTALAEAVWSPPETRDWGSYLYRLKAQLPLLDARSFNYRPLG
ncbi:beta-hexosaminidase [Coccomyxa sp. Obi]|nr:beta-hexosaminidase [Coccomyxa sp. Obi]